MTDAPATACGHSGHVHRTGSRPALLAGLAAVLLVVPLLVSRLMDPAIADDPGSCPFLHATGVPCPACGATRAFVLLAHGDGEGALRFNWSWILVWALAVVALGVAAWRSIGGRPAAPEWLRSAGHWLQAYPAAVVVLPFLLLAGPWLVAMANLPAIR
jgi:hypothetical protein